MVMKKILYFILLPVLAIIAGFFIWRFIDYSKEDNPNKTFLLPRAEISIVEITSVTNDEIEMNVKMLLKNQLPISFTADSVQYSIYINHVEVIKNQYKKSVSLEGSDSTWILLPIKLLSEQLFSILKESDQQQLDSVEYEIKTTFYSDLLFKKQFDLHVTKLLPLIRPPQLLSKQVQLESLNFSRASLLFEVEIKNRNVYSIQAKDINFRIAIEDNEWIEGKLPGLTVIPEKSVTDLQIPIELSLKAVGKTLLDLIKKGKAVKYKLDVRFKISSENKSVNDSDVILKSTGSIKSLLNLRKG